MQKNLFTKSKTSISTKLLGDKFERIARNHVKAEGIEIITSNYHAKTGEIDFIGLENTTLIFFEVRARSNTHFGTPEETITFKKQQRIRRTAEKFLQTNKSYQHTLCRFDVISITYSEKDHSINWIKNAF